MESEEGRNEVKLVLVTGASGYIGTHITKLLLDKGYRVRGTVRSTSNTKKIDPLLQLAEAANAQERLELCECDLSTDTVESWRRAVDGCSHVIHTASPFPLDVPDREDELVRPARDGTRRVLEACCHDDRVRRVVVTSSVAAIYGDTLLDGHVYTENDWPHDQSLFPYAKSKYLAERAAWDFVKERREKGLPCFELATINPGYVMVLTQNNTFIFQFSSFYIDL